VEVVLTGVVGVITVRAEMTWTAAVTILFTPDRITTILHKQADMGMNVMEGAADEETFSEVFTVVEDTRVGVEVPTRVLIPQGRRIHHKALHKVLTLTREDMVLKMPVTEGNHILGISIPADIAPTTMVIDMVIIRTAHTEAILQIIQTVGMVGMVVHQAQGVATVHMVHTVHTVDIQTKPVTLHEALTMATREAGAEAEADEVLVL